METSQQSVPPRPSIHAPSAASAALILAGFSAVTAQIVLLRELIVVFSGNEISMGILLAAWLFWTAIGSGLASRISFGEHHPRRVVGALEVLLALSLPPTIWALRASRSHFESVPGELLGLIPMALASLVCLSLFCIVSGVLFVAAARLCRAESALTAHDASSSAYMFEALGSAIGGLAASLLLLPFLSPFQIAAIVAVLNLVMAAVILARPSRRQIRLLAAAAILCAVPLVFVAAPWAERAAQKRLWQGFHLLASRDSIYSNLAVTETGEIRSLYSNGVLVANAPDPSAAEEAVHYALLEHPAPRRVLLIGGGTSGGLAEAFKHPAISQIDYVELNPALLTLVSEFMPAQSATLADPRVRVHYADGRAFLRASRDQFDVILVNLPDPQTAQLNRFYTEEFFRAARAHLAPGGLLAFSLHASEETISPDLANFLRCIERTLQVVFPYNVAIPGDTIHFFAATRPGVLTADSQNLLARMRQRNLQTQYVREYFLPFRMMPDRMEQLRTQLAPTSTTPLNRDFAPVAYYFSTVLWSAQFNAASSRWFRAAAGISFPRLAATLAACLLITVVILLFQPAHRRSSIAACGSAAATGFTLMALQILLLLAFESLYGYVYRQLAILIGLGMAGIACGTWLGIRRAHATRTPIRAMGWMQLALALSAPALIAILSLMTCFSSTPATWIAAQCVFPALAAFSGLLGGYQFPIATAVYLAGTRRQSLGALYAMDLVGGCAGALLLSTFLIPVFGFWSTAWLSAAINLAPAVLAAGCPTFAQPEGRS